MMKTLFTTAAAAIGATMLLASPAAAGKWEDCDYAAKVYAVNNTNVGGATVGSAVVGGLLGLGISSITGNVNTAGNVAIGAGIGGVAGFVASNAKQKALYDSYMASCMGGSVQPQPIVMPQPSAFPPPSGQAGQYKVNSLNVRVCPQANANCPSMGSIPYGGVVAVQSCNTPAPNPSGWCYVGAPQGWGWASKSYLTFY